MSVVAILTTGERIPLTDGWDEARRLFKAGEYDSDVVELELSEAPEPAKPDETTDVRKKGK
jgi:hypothetical protein